MLKTTNEAGMCMKTKKRRTMCPERVGHLCTRFAHFIQTEPYFAEISGIFVGFPARRTNFSVPSVQTQGTGIPTVNETMDISKMKVHPGMLMKRKSRCQESGGLEHGSACPCTIMARMAMPRARTAGILPAPGKAVPLPHGSLLASVWDREAPTQAGGMPALPARRSNACEPHLC